MNRQLLVIIPALNEAATIQKVIAGIPRNIEGISDTQVLVVDDGSIDNTAELAQQEGASVVSHSANFGVGAAIQTGLSEAVRRGTDIAVNVDGDGQFDPQDIEKLVRPILEGRAEFVTASRFKDPSFIPDMPRLKRYGNAWMSRLVSFLSRRKYYDVSCGFRAYSREVLLRLALQGRFTYTQETFLVLSFKGIPIEEVPVAVRGTREHGKSRVASNLFVFAYRTLGIIFTCFRDYHPLIVFNSGVAVTVLLGVGFGGFFLWHYVTSGSFSPHIWSGFVAAAFFFVGLILFWVGQIAAMLNRVRLLQEEQLYLARLQLQRNADHAKAPREAPASVSR